MRTNILFALAMLMLPLFAAAHPGHGHTDGQSFWHYFIEPKHALAGMLVAIGLAAVWMYRRQQISRNKEA